MSRIGKKPIAIPGGVKIEQQGQNVKVTGPKGTLEMAFHPKIAIAIDGPAVAVSNTGPDDRIHKALHGTMRALLNNLVVGVSEGFRREMKVFGTGYSVKEQGGKLVLQVGFCHPIEMPIPKGITLEIKTAATKGNDLPAVFTLSGPDKHRLGQFAADVRKVRPPEPYQGKGIRYADEHVIRKEGKALGAGG